MKSVPFAFCSTVCAPTNDEQLTTALAALQNERLHSALQLAEVEQLRARLAELEGTPDTAPIKRKM